jgi:predicted NBD/HSP70 family sugar kinase
MTRVAVDLGGTKVAVARVDGARVLERREAPTPAAAGPEAVVDAVVALLAGWPVADGLAVAATGRVVDGVVHAVNRATLPGWEGFPLAGALGDRLGAPAFVANDAQAAAWGEHRFGAGAGLEDLLFVTVSTGVGAGVVAAGRLVTGARGLAGHLGFVRGAVGEGFLEAHASGVAIARAGAVALGGAPTTREVVAAADAGDPRAARVVDDAVAALARALVDVRWLLDPARVAVGGSVGLAPSYLPRLRAALARLEPEAAPWDVVPATLGRDAGLIGVADLAPGAAGAVADAGAAADAAGS